MQVERKMPVTSAIKLPMENFDLAKQLFFEGLSSIEHENFEEAALKFQESLVLVPDRLSTLTNLTAALIRLRKYPEAKVLCLKAIELDSKSPEAWHNLGLIERSTHNYDAALNHFNNAIRLKANYAQAWAFKGVTLHNLKRHEEALSSLDVALGHNPGYAEAWIFRGNVLKDLGRMDDGLASYRRALEYEPENFGAYSNLLFAMLYDHRCTPMRLLQESRQFGSIVAARVHAPYTSWLCHAHPKRLRVGLVSGDIRNHSVGHFLEGLLKHIDPARLELIAYPTDHEQDELTRRIRHCFCEWKPLYGKTDEAAARLIHADGIHVLIDLSGHTRSSRLTAFAWKPAPVQVTWLGLPMTTGLAEIDYVLGDHHAIPPGFENQFSETVWRLPDSYLCLTVPTARATPSPLPALNSGIFTFGSFNNPSKITEDVITVWTRLLDSVPNSRLLLKAKQFGDEKFQQEFKERFFAHGLERNRLDMMGALTYEEHFEAYNKVDIALDTFPYPGVTTSIEALWMGVPVLSLQGDRFLSCTASSIAHSAGLPDWIATDRDDYVTKASRFASDLGSLSGLRQGLRNQVLASPLFDAPRFARHFDDALWEMWARSQAGNS